MSLNDETLDMVIFVGCSISLPSRERELVLSVRVVGGERKGRGDQTGKFLLQLQPREGRTDS